MDEGNSGFVEQSGETDSQPSQVETIQVDYSDQLTVIANQQQICIGLLGILLGVLVCFAFMSVFSRFL